MRDWSRLARYVRERREELGLTQEEVATRGGPSTATLRLIEGGESGIAFRPKSLRQLSEALGWTADSATAILAGREPAIRGAASQGQAVPPPETPGIFGVMNSHPRSQDEQRLQIVATTLEDQVVKVTRHIGEVGLEHGIVVRSEDEMDKLNALDGRVLFPGDSGLVPGNQEIDEVLAGLWDIKSASVADRIDYISLAVLKHPLAQQSRRRPA